RPGSGSQPVRQTVDRLQPEFDPGAGAQASIAAEQRRQKQRPGLGAEYDRGGNAQDRARSRGAPESPPIPRGPQCERKQQTKLRFIGQKTERHGRSPWPVLAIDERQADQRRGQQAVMPKGEAGGNGKRRESANEWVR